MSGNYVLGRWISRRRPVARQLLVFASTCLILTVMIIVTVDQLPSQASWPPITPRLSNRLFRAKQGVLVHRQHETSRHPIVDLIERAEALWEAKLKRQSTTLQQAYDEYIRRYGRRPPRGFDSWKWCREHNVQLLDEFDSIHNSIEPFWAIYPARLEATRREIEKHQEVFTIGKDSPTDNVSILQRRAPVRASGITRDEVQLSVVKPVADLLPPFRVTWSFHDRPLNTISWDLQEKVQRAIAVGKYVNHADIPDRPWLWSSACPPDSPLHHFNISNKNHDLFEYMNATPKTFISDLYASMDPCHNPDLVHISVLGDIAGHRPLKDLAPVFMLSKTTLHAGILGVPTHDPLDPLPSIIPWPMKREKRVLWRGSTTGMSFREGKTGMNMTQRLRFVHLTNLKSGAIPVLPPPANLEGAASEPQKWDLEKLNKMFFDTGFVSVNQCEPALCVQLRRELGSNIRGRVNGKEEQHYQYIMDMDGNGWSSRFRRLLGLNAVILKSTVHPEWWMDRAIPWVHFVPIKLDYSDLYDTMAFFRGLPDGTTGHDSLAEKIAISARQWVDRYWRKEDVTAYTWRLYLEYIRVTSMDRESMDFVLPR